MVEISLPFSPRYSVSSLPCVTGQCTLAPHHHQRPYTLTLDNSTNLSSIEAALAAMASLGLEEEISYKEIAKIHGVNRSTLSRRYRGQTASRTANVEERQNLHHQQKQQLLLYTKRLTE